eukprot:tig00021013_g17073.t1
MWPLRGVCRRWRRVIEETDWSSIELRTDEEKSAGSAPSRHGVATALVEERKLRLGDGASVSGGGGGGGGAAPAQPREVVFGVLGSEDGDEEDGCGEDFLRRFVLGALRALRPPGGAPSLLEGLLLCLKNRAAAAAAAACPLLRSLSFRPDLASESAALAALAPLARLERPAPLFGAARADHCLAGDASWGGLGAIAEGPAGRSLRSLCSCLLDETRSWPAAEPSEAAVRALARLPRLERREPLGLILNEPRVAGDRPRPRRRRAPARAPPPPRGRRPRRGRGALGAVGGALPAPPCPSSLTVELYATSTSPRDVAALLSGAGARRPAGPRRARRAVRPRPPRPLPAPSPPAAPPAPSAAAAASTVAMLVRALQAVGRMIDRMVATTGKGSSVLRPRALLVKGQLAWAAGDARAAALHWTDAAELASRLLMPEDLALAYFHLARRAGTSDGPRTAIRADRARRLFAATGNSWLFGGSGRRCRRCRLRPAASSSAASASPQRQPRASANMSPPPHPAAAAASSSSPPPAPQAPASPAGSGSSSVATSAARSRAAWGSPAPGPNPAPASLDPGPPPALSAPVSQSGSALSDGSAQGPPPPPEPAPAPPVQMRP